MPAWLAVIYTELLQTTKTYAKVSGQGYWYRAAFASKEERFTWVTVSVSSMQKSVTQLLPLRNKGRKFKRVASSIVSANFRTCRLILSFSK